MLSVVSRPDEGVGCALGLEVFFGGLSGCRSEAGAHIVTAPSAIRYMPFLLGPSSTTAVFSRLFTRTLVPGFRGVVFSEATLSFAPRAAAADDVSILPRAHSVRTVEKLALSAPYGGLAAVRYRSYCFHKKYC